MELGAELDELTTAGEVELDVGDDPTSSTAEVDFTTGVDEDFTAKDVEDARLVLDVDFVLATTAAARDVELLTTAELEDWAAAFVVEAGTGIEDDV